MTARGRPRAGCPQTCRGRMWRGHGDGWRITLDRRNPCPDMALTGSLRERSRKKLSPGPSRGYHSPAKVRRLPLPGNIPATDMSPSRQSPRAPHRRRRARFRGTHPTRRRLRAVVAKQSFLQPFETVTSCAPSPPASGTRCQRCRPCSRGCRRRPPCARRASPSRAWPRRDSRRLRSLPSQRSIRARPSRVPGPGIAETH